jgi:hypothetical protein
MNITRLVRKFLLLGSLLTVGFCSSEEVVEGFLVLLLVLISLLGAGQLLDEENVDDLDELVLDQLVV